MGTQREECYLTGMTLLCLEYCKLRMRSVPLDHNCIILLYTCGVVCAAKQFANWSFRHLAMFLVAALVAMSNQKQQQKSINFKAYLQNSIWRLAPRLVNCAFNNCMTLALLTMWMKT